VPDASRISGRLKAAAAFGLRQSSGALGSGASVLAGLAVLLVGWSPASAATAANDIRRDATVIAIEQVNPSVVNIATETIIEQRDWYEELFRRFYGVPGRQQKSLNLGSGVIIDEEGYIVTNFHVVRRASRIQVKLWDGREFEADPQVATETSDVALLKIRSKPGDKFKAIKFAEDDDLLLGETVLALGNPFGLGSSVSKGILSSKNRRPSTGGEPLNIEDWLQTDAAINPGNSGGPLVNLRGELIGLNVAVFREQNGEGLGFSIPVRQVSLAVARFFAPEVTDSLWFGGQIKGSSGHWLVSTVQPSSPAARAGLKEGDRVVQVNGQTPETLISLNRLLVANSNRQAQVTVQRGAESLKLAVRMIPFEDMIQQKLGLTLLEPNAQTARQLGVNPGDGLYIEDVEADGPAGQVKLQRGFILTGIDRVKAREIRIVGERLSSTKRGDSITLSLIAPLRVGNFVEFRQGTVEVKVR
jgi:serine protease Do